MNRPHLIVYLACKKQFPLRLVGHSVCQGSLLEVMVNLRGWLSMRQLHTLLWFFQSVMGNLSIKFSFIIKIFLYFSLEVWPKKVESGVFLLDVHLSLVMFPRWNMIVDLHLLLTFNLISLISFAYIRVEEIWGNFSNHLYWISLISFGFFPLLWECFPGVTTITHSNLQTFNF